MPWNKLPDIPAETIAKVRKFGCFLHKYGIDAKSSALEFTIWCPDCARVEII